MNTYLALAACCAAISLAGCTNLPKAQDYSTSLGPSQSQLRQDPEWSAGRVWVRPGPPIGSQYDKKLILEPMEYIQGDRPDDLDMRDDPAMRQRALAYMNEALRREFAQSGYQLLTVPAPRALRVRAAITGTFKNDRDPRAMEYSPIGYVIGQTVKAAGFRDKSARLLIEAAVRDANTNELLIASAGTVTGSNLPADRKPTAEDVRSAIDEWAREVREQFDRIWLEDRPEAG
ncbi:DUF3313 domain-containing protein [Achromobacter denitrificans]